MKRWGERLEQRGEGRLLAAALIVVLALSLVVYWVRLPETQVISPLHAVSDEVYRAGLVDINRADADEIASLPGVGDILAERIVDYRMQNGPFRSADDLLKVAGIGEGKFADLRGLIYTG